MRKPPANVVPTTKTVDTLELALAPGVIGVGVAATAGVTNDPVSAAVVLPTAAESVVLGAAALGSMGPNSAAQDMNAVWLERAEDLK